MSSLNLVRFLPTLFVRFEVWWQKCSAALDPFLSVPEVVVMSVGWRFFKRTTFAKLCSAGSGQEILPTLLACLVRPLRLLKEWRRGSLPKSSRFCLIRRRIFSTMIQPQPYKSILRYGGLFSTASAFFSSGMNWHKVALQQIFQKSSWMVFAAYNGYFAFPPPPDWGPAPIFNPFSSRRFLAFCIA